jgi:hypothetical protein
MAAVEHLVLFAYRSLFSFTTLSTRHSVCFVRWRRFSVLICTCVCFVQRTQWIQESASGCYATVVTFHRRKLDTNRLQKIRNSHSGSKEKFHFLGYNALKSGERQPTFRTNISPPFSGLNNKSSYIPEDTTLKN